MTLRPTLLAALVLFGWMAAGLAAPMRVAVISDSPLADLAALTTSELSRQPGVTLLERAELDQLSREAGIQNALGSRDLTGVNLTPAEGLVLLRASGKGGNSGVFARLVAVQPGIVLREIALPEGLSPAEQAAALAQDFAPWWPKLAAALDQSARKVSLLGLRCEVDGPEARDLERRMNLLLASRLSASPGAIVLERWRLHDAVFEKAISAAEPAPFWQGSALVDGSLRMRGGEVAATLRLRRAHGKEETFTDHETLANLPALADRLARKISDGEASPPEDWKPAAEAAHFSRLGQWCLDNRLYDEGAQAIESALALGDDSRTTRSLQVKAQTMRAYPDDLRPMNTTYEPLAFKIPRDSLPDRLEAAARAASLAARYLRDYPDNADRKVDPEDPFKVGLAVLNNCLCVLQASVNENLFSVETARLADARHAIQELIPILQERLAGKSDLEREFFRIYLVHYACIWNKTPADTIAYYREILRSGRDADEIRFELFKTPRPPYLDGEGTPAFSPSEKSPPLPWLVGWNGETEEVLREIWRKFVGECTASPEPVVRADGLKFEYLSDHTSEGRTQTTAKVVALLKDNKSVIQSPRGAAFVAGFSSCYNWATKDEAQQSALLDFCIACLKEQAPLPSAFLTALERIPSRENPSTERLRELLEALDSYSSWTLQQKPDKTNRIRAIERARQSILIARPELAKPVPVDGRFIINRLWQGRIKADPPTTPGRKLPTNTRTLTTFDDKLWFLTTNSPPEVVCLDPATREVVSTLPVPAELDLDKQRRNSRPLPRSLTVTKDWIVLAMGGQVLVCPRPGQEWRALDLPVSAYKPCWVEGNLYLLYNVYKGDSPDIMNIEGKAIAGSGLIRVSLPEGKTEDLVSSRRTPPRNPLDGKPLGRPTELWMTKDGLTLSTDFPNPHFQVFASPPGASDWRLVASDNSPCRIKLTPDGAVIGHAISSRSFAKLSLMNKSDAEVLLANPGAAQPGDPAPVWKFPEEFRDTPPGTAIEICPMMRNGDLWLLYIVRAATNTSLLKPISLYRFRRGVSDALEIPLSFEASAIKASPSQAFQGLASTREHLIIPDGSADGFWILPWADLEAWSPTAARPKP